MAVPFVEERETKTRPHSDAPLPRDRVTRCGCRADDEASEAGNPERGDEVVLRARRLQHGDGGRRHEDDRQGCAKASAPSLRADQRRVRAAPDEVNHCTANADESPTRTGSGRVSTQRRVAGRAVVRSASRSRRARSWSQWATRARWYVNESTLFVAAKNPVTPTATAIVAAPTRSPHSPRDRWSRGGLSPRLRPIRRDPASPSTTRVQIPVSTGRSKLVDQAQRLGRGDENTPQPMAAYQDRVTPDRPGLCRMLAARRPRASTGSNPSIAQRSMPRIGSASPDPELVVSGGIARPARSC